MRTSKVSIWHPAYHHSKDEMLEHMRRLAQGTTDGHLGVEITEIGDDYVRGTVPVDERTRQPFGLLHGGISVVLAETLGSIGGNLCVDPATSMCVGLDVNANHLRAVRDGKVTGTARPVHLGKSTQVWEIKLRNEQDQLSCIARLTLAIVPRSR